MKLVHAKYNLCLLISEEKPTILIVENPDVMSELVSSLLRQSMGSEGDFVLVNDDVQIDFPKCVEVIINPFSIDFNSKKTISSLYANLSRTGNDYIEKKSEVLQNSVSLLDYLISKESFIGLTYTTDFEWNSFFKLFGVQFEDEYESLIMKLTEYIKLLSTFSKTKLIVFINLSSYLSQNDLNQLLKASLYCKIRLVFLESHDQLSFSTSNACILDKDICLIFK